MELTLPQDISFECPKGTHSATFYEAKPTMKGDQDFVRLLFQAPDLTTDTKIVLVGRNFAPSLHRNSQLRVFLDTWLGADFVEDHSVAGKFDFDSLQNKNGAMAVQNIQNKTHAKPFVYLEAMHPITTPKEAEETLSPAIKSAETGGCTVQTIEPEQANSAAQTPPITNTTTQIQSVPTKPESPSASHDVQPTLRLPDARAARLGTRGSITAPGRTGPKNRFSNCRSLSHVRYLNPEIA